MTFEGVLKWTKSYPYIIYNNKWLNTLFVVIQDPA